MSYKLDFSNDALSRLEDLGRADAKLLRQIFVKILSLRRTPYPQDFKELKDFRFGELKGCRVDQGEYRILYAVDEQSKTVKIRHIASRNEDYRELQQIR